MPMVSVHALWTLTHAWSQWQCWLLLHSRFGWIAITEGMGVSPPCQQKQENWQMEGCRDSPGLSAPTPLQTSPLSSSVHRMAVSPLTVPLACPLTCPSVQASPSDLAIFVLIWVTKSPYCPGKCWVRSAKHIYPHWPSWRPSFCSDLLAKSYGWILTWVQNKSWLRYIFSSWSTLPPPASL